MSFRQTLSFFGGVQKLIALTETWHKEQDFRTDLEIDGFGVPYRLDRDATVTGKSLGGGVCLYVNRKWCNVVVVREAQCTRTLNFWQCHSIPFTCLRNSHNVL